ncbi:MAG: HlyC/CorC family transporter [Ardenticatenales bacterium]|nr:HlyC/CorC family transporter [Ardenticatenales bacterium]
MFAVDLPAFAAAFAFGALAGWLGRPWWSRRLGRIGLVDVRDEALRTFVAAESGDETLEESSIERIEEMFEGVVELGQAKAREVMVPRVDIVSIPDTVTLDEALDCIIAEGHSRIPVHHETLDSVVGILYAKDLLKRFRDRDFKASVTDLVRPPTFVPESKPVDELLRELQASKVHIAIVVDEYGGTAGLVTIEDILEEIVGEIRDEYDPEETDVESLDAVAGRGTFKATAHIDAVNDLLDLHLPADDDVETVGGLVFSALGRVPSPGDSATIGDARIEVLDVEGSRILRVRVVRLRTEAAERPDLGANDGARPLSTHA